MTSWGVGGGGQEETSRWWHRTRSVGPEDSRVTTHRHRDRTPTESPDDRWCSGWVDVEGTGPWRRLRSQFDPVVSGTGVDRGRHTRGETQSFLRDGTPKDRERVPTTPSGV